MIRGNKKARTLRHAQWRAKVATGKLRKLRELVYFAATQCRLLMAQPTVKAPMVPVMDQTAI